MTEWVLGYKDHASLQKEVPMPPPSCQLLEMLGRRRAGTGACGSGIEQITSDASMESLKRAERRERNSALDFQMLLNQMKEITGIQDSAFLLAALKAANGDLMEAVTFLTEEHAPEPGQEVAAAEPSDWEGSAVGKELPQNEDEGPEAEQIQKEVEALFPELRHYIQEDNWRLEQEAEEWEEEQSCKIPQMEPSPASESQDVSESGPDQASVCEPGVLSLSLEHARIAKEQTAKAIANTADAYEKNGVEAALFEPKEVEPLKAQLGETSLTVQAEQPQDSQEAEAAAQTSSQVSEDSPGWFGVHEVRDTTPGTVIRVLSKVGVTWSVSGPWGI
ncbi:hypothetical protein WISP_11796 [Willisornis vidua]|uniref:UBA-like domain-containing protein n=1 Tax=Willisornis vidua TaxID=1566151 RepID=A0ABQ9DWP6_9PASS|nr:hypothetical protein WISP_11796 [Willisornis vidua]